MKKTIFVKSLLLLFTLIVGGGNAHAQEDYDYEWVKTDFSSLATGDAVVLVDENYGIALPNNDNAFLGVNVTASGNKLSTVSNNIQWEITRNGNNIELRKLVSGHPENPLYVTSGNALAVGNSTATAFTHNGGYLSSNEYYISWADVYTGYKAELQDGLSGPNSAAEFSFYKKVRKNYVKWKKVSVGNLANDDVVAVVDLTTAKAMSNDKGEKEPDAVDVSLNFDKDRITGEVPAKIQWTYTGSGSGFQLFTGDNPLYADSEGLKVGTGNANNVFSIKTVESVDYLGMTIADKDYLAGAESSMFSNIWKWMEKTSEGKADDAVKDTRVAFFKKVEDEKKIVTIELPEYFNVDKSDATTLDLKTKATITGASWSDVVWSSSDTDIATVSDGVVTLKERGSVVIVARVAENTYHDVASAGCTVVIDDKTSTDLGSRWMPLTVAEAKELAKEGSITSRGKSVTWKAGVNYYIKGKVSKVNSGMMAMFGDMDFGAMMENMGGGTGEGMGNMNFEEEMDDMDFDMEDMEESGFEMPDFSSMGFDMSAFFGSSDKVSYYISDDGTKDNQMKVINGHGTINSQEGGVLEFNDPDLSPGDWVVVCGPLVYTEDTNMFSGMMGNNDDKPKYSAKVDELNYLDEYDPTLLIKGEVPKEVYVKKSLNGSALYEIDDEYQDTWVEGESGYQLETLTKFPEGVNVQPATFKSSDEDIAKWDEATNTIVGVQEGKAKITVKVKVIVTPDDPNTTEENEEKSYTMKRKFKLIVKTRDLLPEGYYAGDYVLTTTTGDLLDGTRLVLVGTRVKEGKEDTDYMMVENNAMMGGGKNGSKIEFDDSDSNKETIPSSTVIAKKGLEIVLEKAEEGTFWYLNVGQDETGNKLYLYASDTSDGSDNNNNSMMDMFMSDNGLKVSTKEAMGSEKLDSLQATITIDGSNNATIQFPKTAGKKTLIKLDSSFDMAEMMEMMGNMGNQEESEQGDGGSSSSDEFDMSSFDMFMATFNTKKADDAKGFMPRIYRFVPDREFDITIGSTEWRTIVTYKDVSVPEAVEAYIVTKVTPEETHSVARLKPVGQLKGGEPYLLHSQEGDFTLTLLPPDASDELQAPADNKLKKSDRTITGSSNSSTVYVLANKTNGVGFYKWTGEELGAGRVYLPVEASLGAHEYCAFLADEATTIQTIDKSETHTGPFYDMQGRRVDNPAKGIYIANGKKVIVK